MTERIQIKGGIYFRSVLVNRRDYVSQHVHTHDHATYVGKGRCQLWEDGRDRGIFTEGDVIEIKAGAVHKFDILENETRLVCVWPENVDEDWKWAG